VSLNQCVRIASYVYISAVITEISKMPHKKCLSDCENEKKEKETEANVWKLPKMCPSYKQVYVGCSSQFFPPALSSLVTPLVIPLPSSTHLQQSFFLSSFLALFLIPSLLSLCFLPLFLFLRFISFFLFG
jgi:hypothetical protein